MQADLVIIGAGPAGMAAAQTAAGHGIEVLVIDDQARAGGQVLRQPPAQFRVEKWLAQRVYRNTQRLLKTATAKDGIRWLHRTSVLGTFKKGEHYEIHLNGPDGVSTLTTRRILVATGCYDMPVSFPGNTLPGVMATGGIQAFVKSQQIVPGDRFVFAGSHPLQLIVADQVMKAGGRVEAVVFSQPLSTALEMMKSALTLLRYPTKLAYLAGAWFRLAKSGVRISFGSTLSRANGDGALESVTIERVSTTGQAQDIACDSLGICFSFLASTELLRQAGARCYWSESRGGWIAEHDQWQRSSLPGIYVAGEVTGVAGDDVAHQEGIIAGIAVAADEEAITEQTAKRLARSARHKLGRLQGFADLLSALAYPGAELLNRLRTDDSLLCKCEEVTVGQVRETLLNNPANRDLSSIKLLSRCGMGLCQGRYCAYQLSILLAHETGQAPQELGSFTARFPARPVTIGSLLEQPDNHHGPGDFQRE